MGLDVDLVSAAERGDLPDGEIDRRKEEYLTGRLLPFPLRPHWLVETRHGFHAVYRVQAQRSPEGIRDAQALNVRLVRVLGGDPNAVLLTQVFRVPGYLQFKDPRAPFLCRLLLDNAAVIAPYHLSAVRGLLDTWERLHPTEPGGQGGHDAEGVRRPRPWQDGLSGVPEGQRNAAAAAILGGILVRLPECLWETAGWGGLREWNKRNEVPLAEHELRSVFESIARREHGKRRARQSRPPEGPPSTAAP
jgi:hypothetical protein